MKNTRLYPTLRNALKTTGLASLLVVLSMPVLRSEAPATLQDFEKESSLPKTWVVNMPPDAATVKLSTEHPQDGKQSLQLHYKFTSEGEFQYLGVPLELKMDSSVKLRYWIYGDKSLCSYGLQLTDSGGETHQFGKLGVIDFTGWKEIVIDLDGGHETWGGDKNGQIDYPVTGMNLTIGQAVDGGLRRANESDLFFDSIVVEPGKSAKAIIKRGISVLSPAYCSDIQGDTKVAVSAAPGLDKVTVKCWKQGTGFGTDSTVATVPLDAEGNGSFVFPADSYPHGPITVRISGAIGENKDTCYLQLYNKGGVSWNEGLPSDPPQTLGMKMVFQDDFKGPLSIGADSTKTYYQHKPPTGSEDFSFPLTFRNFESPENPFSQVDSYLRIRADAAKKSAGIISSLHGDGKGLTAAVPCYFECRFIGPNAPGSWPAFWLMTDYINNPTKLVDELDIIEAYGGEGPGAPNAGDKYLITPHVWNYSPEDKAKQEAMLKKEWPYPYLVSMNKLGVPSTWYEAPHTYGVMVTEKETSYYLDNILIGSHATLPMCKERPLFFMINLAVGGGWPVNLSRYNGVADMYVDFVRVYQGKK